MRSNKEIEWEKVAEIFEEALHLNSLEEQLLFLKEEPSETIQQEVEKLLKAHFKVKDFLERPIFLEFIEKAIEAGDSFDDFYLLRKLGQGSFGTVFLAREISLDREVALKISPNLGSEARNMASLEHKNIVRVFSEKVDPVSKKRLLCMQFVPGVSLEQLMKSIQTKPLDFWTAPAFLERLFELNPQGEFFVNPKVASFDYVQYVLWLGEQMAQALACAHSQGVLHLDVKPGNVLLNYLGTPFLTDFNVSIDSSDGNRAQMVGGTLDYMSPEHRAYLFEAGEVPTEKSDVFSLVVMLKKMLDLVPPQSETILQAQYRNDLEKYFSQCLSQERPLAVQLAKKLAASLERRDIANAIPPITSLHRFGVKFPVPTAFLLCLIPNVVGSYFNIVHNQMRIVNDLNDFQQVWFMRLCLVYNVFAFPICIFFCIRKLLEAIPVLKREDKYFSLSSAQQAVMRKRLLNLPRALALISSAGWLPSTLFFSIALSEICGPITFETFIHFFISNGSAWAVATPYSYLFLQLFFIRAIYPFTLSDVEEVKQTAFRETQPILAKLNIFYWLAGFIPLTAMILIMLTTPSLMAGFALSNLKILMVLLSVISMVGFATSVKGSANIEEVFFALTGKSLRGIKNQ